MLEDRNLITDTAPPEMDCVYRYVGGRLRGLRVARGMTQAQVASIISVSPQQYQKYEDAQSKCSLPYLLKLAAHYGVHINDLLPVETPTPGEIDPDTQLANEADLLSRLVSAFVRMEDRGGKLRLVQLVETLVPPRHRNPGEHDG